MTEKLVFTGKVLEINQIPGAERIEHLIVVCGQAGKWSGCAQKNQFQVGDLCTVFMQDSILPEIEEYEFMRRHKFRVRMCRFLGVPSEVLIMPYRIGEIGQDVTEAFDVRKYEKPLPAGLQGGNKGNFPSFIPKTDEPNFQGVPHVLEYMKGKPCYITEKADGTSVTVYYNNGVFGVCSRNFEKKESDNVVYWQIAKKYNLNEVLSKYCGGLGLNIALQMEGVGPGIQGNPMGLKSLEARLFNIFYIDESRYGGIEEVRSASYLFDIPMVKVLDEDFILDHTDEELRKLAEGTYPNGKQREGIVVRLKNDEIIKKNLYQNDRCSFKVINLNYKD